MIIEGSRYEDSDIVMTQAADGTYTAALYYKGFLQNGGVLFKYRSVTENEFFDTIATEVYGDPELWWVVAKLNPEIVHPDDLTAGTVIRVPLA